MKIAEILLELRKNPEQNPKVTINTELYNAIEQASSNSDLIEGIPNVFVSFTNIDKLGINPNSQYNTPLGIYSYPGSYVKEKVGSRGMDKLPFAGNSKYATIFKAQGNIVNLSTMTEVEEKNYYKKIAEYWSRKSGKDLKTASSYINDILWDLYDADEPETYDINSDVDPEEQIDRQIELRGKPGFKFWYVTRVIARMAAERLNPTARDMFGVTIYPYPTSWNAIFRAIGIDGCIDTGSGIIHPSEPTQAVFFSIKSVKVIAQVYNKANYLPSNIAKNVKIGSDLNTKHTSKFERFRSKTLNSQKKSIEQNPMNIRYMSNPPEELQWAAVKQYIYAIQAIRNPSEALQLNVVGRNGHYIKLLFKTVKNPSQAVQIAAVKRTLESLGDIIEQGILPSPAVQLAAVRGNPDTTFEILARHNVHPCPEIKPAYDKYHAQFD